jgi:NADH dehydrogenase
LSAAKALSRQNVQITLIDRRNHHLFQPLLYQVATAGLAPGDISSPLRRILKHHKNIEVRLGQVIGVEVAKRRVQLTDARLAYDYLIVAAGAKHAYFGHDEWADRAPGLKTIGDALEIRRRILVAFERAEFAKTQAERERLTTFVVIGGGPTGVELAGAIAEIAFVNLQGEFRRIDTRKARIVLIEAGPDVLATFHPTLRAKARSQIEALGVVVRTGQPVTQIDEQGVILGPDERIAAETILWAAGVQASELGKGLGVPLDRAGRVIVEPDLSIPGHPEVMVIGDQAHCKKPGQDKPFPGVAPVATAMGQHAADNIAHDLAGRPRVGFDVADRGAMATIGTNKAILESMGFRMSGRLAWLAWLFVHIMVLVGFRNRFVVFMKWTWAWLTFDQSSRLIWQGEGAETWSDPHAHEDEFALPARDAPSTEMIPRPRQAAPAGPGGP